MILNICEFDLGTESFPYSFQKLDSDLCSKSYEGLKIVKSEAIIERQRFRQAITFVMFIILG